MLTMIPVSSSNLSAIGYENGNLYIRFHSGRIYMYLNVPHSEYIALLHAPSHGTYFHAHIRNFYTPRQIS